VSRQVTAWSQSLRPTDPAGIWARARDLKFAKSSRNVGLRERTLLKYSGKAYLKRSLFRESDPVRVGTWYLCQLVLGASSRCIGANPSME